MKTGSKRIVCNVWSDAAREASAATRKSGSSGQKVETAKTAEEHDAAAKYHRGVFWRINFDKTSTFDDLQAHVAAADAHELAARSLRPAPKGFSNFTRLDKAEDASSDARGASMNAHLRPTLRDRQSARYASTKDSIRRPPDFGSKPTRFGK